MTRFKFQCDEAGDELKLIHDILRSLVNSQAQAAQKDAEYVSHFVAAIPKQA
jgi:hypothetical protein